MSSPNQNLCDNIKLEIAAEYDEEIKEFPESGNELTSSTDIKCGEICYSNKHFQLNCNYCQKKFTKIKTFSKHFLKLHLNLNINESKNVLEQILHEEDSNKESIEIELSKETDTVKTTVDSIDLIFNADLSNDVKEEISNAGIVLFGKEKTLDIEDEDNSSILDNDDGQSDNEAENDENSDDKSKETRCKFCEKLYKRKSDLTKHKLLCKKDPNNINSDSETKKERNLVCKYNCGRTFQRKCDLSHHENHKHNADGTVKNWVPKIKTFICETCGNCYQRKHYLIQHQRVHTGERPYSCELCPKTFTKKTNLMLHMRHHSQERKFKCQYCGKGLTDANKLRMHEMIHTGLYPFKCDICGKKFPCNSKLNVHIKKHINDRIYKCDLCEKRFLDPETLKGHAAVHSDDKPFACEICPARFPRKGALRLHMNLHSEKKKYCCKLCQMEFHQYNGIYSHYKRHGIKYSIAYEKGECDGTADPSELNE